MKAAVELVQSDLKKDIGAPEDYNKNLDKNNFPVSTDIRIPANRSSMLSIGEALEDLDLVEAPPSKAMKDDHYMPIKALN